MDKRCELKYLWPIYEFVISIDDQIPSQRHCI